MTRHPVLVDALRDLIDTARRERAVLDMDHPDRDFYLGVEAAAAEVLKPHLAAARGEEWLAQQSEAFHNGYLAEQAQLSAVLTLPEPPLKLHLPVPPQTAA